MKSILKNIFYLSLLVGLTLGCANDDDYGTPISSCVDATSGLTANVTATELYALASSSATQYVSLEDAYLEAYITSSDGGGNFFKTISMESADGRGFSVAVDVYNTYTKGYEVGRKVFIKLNNLYFQINHSSLVLGQLFNNNVGRIAENSIKDVILLSCDYKSEEDLVHHVTVLQAKNNNYINKLIELSEVEFLAEEMGKPYYDPNVVLGGSTNRNIRDINDNTVIFRTGSFATYAGNIIPFKSGKVRGVMTKFSSDFQFIARIANDIMLDQDVLGEPIPEEPVEPGENSVLLFPGGDFENWSAFTGSLNSFGLQAYATQSAGTGIENSNSLRINTTGAGGNDFVFTTFAYSGLPENPTKIRFWMKGTSGTKSLSLNVYKETSGYFAFNLGEVLATKTVGVAANNQYGGNINTNGQWVQITLDLTTIDGPINLSNFSANLFALKIGSGQPYDLVFDNFTIE